MNRVIHELMQGSDAWRAHRRTHKNASDSAAMLGIGLHMKRSELVRLTATGDERQFSEWEEQYLIAKGHEAEAAARPWAEEIIGEELFPATMSLVVDGVPLSASFDGLTMDEETTWEHKRLNKELVEAMDRGEIPEGFKPQLEQGLLISGAKRCLLMASDGVREGMKHVWYTSDPALRKKLVPGWKQFAEDVANYVHVETTEKAVAQPVKALPALSIQIDGKIAVRDNLAVFGEQLKAFIERIPKAPSTDQEFADADAAVKALKVAEERLDTAEESALGQVASVDELRRQIALFRDLARTTRLATDKLVEARKKAIRQEIIAEGTQALAAHVLKLNERLGRSFMPHISSNFVEAVKGKKTVEGLRDGMETELARAKIVASETATGIALNLQALAIHGKGFEFLFADVAVLCLKGPDDFLLVVKTRIADQEKAEAAKLEAARERIRQEEEAKAKTAAAPQVQASTARVAVAATRPALSVVSATERIEPSPRPEDALILEILSLHFKAPEEIVLAWLHSFDFEAETARLRRISQQA